MGHNRIKLAELPEKPTGWKSRMVAHMNFGRKGGAMSRTVHDEAGREVIGLGHGYDSRIKTGRAEGFYFTDTKEPTGYLTWDEARAKWPTRNAVADSKGNAQ